MSLEFLYIVGAPVVRSVVGWFEKAAEDGKIKRFEIKKLLKTVLKVGTLSVLAYLGFEVAGVPAPELIGAVSGFVADKLIDALKRV